MPAYVYAEVNDQKQAKLFFETYDIPYQIAKSGDRQGDLKVAKLRNIDNDAAYKVMNLFKEFGYGDLCDHVNAFRDADDNTVVTFSPYGGLEEVYVTDNRPSVKARKIDIPGYNVEVSVFSIYDMGTKTVVVRKKRDY